MTTCGVPAVRSFLRLDPTPAVRLTVRPFRRPDGVRARRTFPGSGAYANPERARGRPGGYDLRVRGGPRVVIRFAEGRAWLEEPGGAPVDCHIVAAPVALLLVLYGRIPQWRPIATGQLLTWGRRPWQALGFKRLFLNP